MKHYPLRLIFAVTTVAISIVTPFVQAATLTVTNLNDSGAGSLRRAIADAQANADANNTIVFTPGLSGTIPLVYQLSITAKDLTINGPGADKLILNSTGGQRVISVSNARLAVSGITVANGRGTYGGGILSMTCTLQMNNCAVTGNSATYGGGIFLTQGTASITSTSFIGNSGTTAGGVYVNAAPATLSNCVFSANSATTGGAIAAYPGTSIVTLADSTVSNNTATYGAGIYAYGGTKKITGCTFNANTGADGGAILNDLGAATIANTTCAGNTANYGAAVSNGGNTTLINCTLVGNTANFGGGGIFSDLGTVSIGNSIIAGNNSASGPDVLAFAPVASLGFNLCGNGDGGAAFAASDLVGTAATPLSANLGPLQNNGGATATVMPLAGSPAIDAGSNAVAVDPATGVPFGYDQRGFFRVFNARTDIGAVETQPLAPMTVSNLNDSGPGSLRQAVADSEAGATNGNTVSFSPGLAGTIVLATPLTITTHDVTIAGGGVEKVTVSGRNAVRVFYVANVHVALSGMTIANGRSDYGGGVFSNAATLDIAGAKFAGNTASSGGGAVFVNGGTATVTNAIFTGNATAGKAGALYLNGATATIRASTFTSNTATSTGGGIAAYQSNHLVADSTFTGNSATYGGGFYGYGGAKTISGCTFSGNTSTDGGAVLNDFGPASIVNSTLAGNTANYGGGFSNGGSTTFINCTIAGNTGVFGGGGMFNDYGTTSLGNTIVAGNAAPTGPDILASAPYTPVTSLGFNLIGNGTAASGFVASDLVGTVAAPIDAKLAALADNGGPTRTIALLAGSPALDAGSNALAVDPATGVPLDFDQRGFFRVYVNTTDIGAFEAQPPGPEIVTLTGAQTVEWTSALGTPASITVNAKEAATTPLTVTWTINGQTVQTDTIPAGTPFTSGTKTFTGGFGLGVTTVTVTVSDGATAVIQSTTVTIVDTTPPVITLNGANPMTVEGGSAFSDPGATALDAVDGARPVSVSGSVNVNIVGAYVLTYTAADTRGNTATATRTVNVVDTTPPVITRNGANPMTIERGSTFTDPGATALDAIDGTRPVTASGTVNANVVGTYTITYTASDTHGNTATATRTVNVVDTTAPVNSAISAKNITSTAASIVWTTNEPANSQVDYGRTSALGSTTALAPTLVTAHSVPLTGLLKNTTYFYRVRSRDASGNLSVSATLTFKTARN